MKVTIRNLSDVCTIEVSGRIDSNTYDQLMQEIRTLDYNDKKVVFDFRDVEYISSAGLRVLLSARKKMSENMTIINVSESINDIFHMTGFDAFLDVKLMENGAATFIHSSFKELLKQKTERMANKSVLFTSIIHSN